MALLVARYFVFQVLPFEVCIHLLHDLNAVFLLLVRTGNDRPGVIVGREILDIDVIQESIALTDIKQLCAGEGIEIGTGPGVRLDLFVQVECVHHLLFSLMWESDNVEGEWFDADLSDQTRLVDDVLIRMLAIKHFPSELLVATLRAEEDDSAANLFQSCNDLRIHAFHTQIQLAGKSNPLFVPCGEFQEPMFVHDKEVVFEAYEFNFRVTSPEFLQNRMVLSGVRLRE